MLSAAASPTVMMGEVEERACLFLAGAGEARAGGVRGGVRNDAPRPPEAQERAMRSPVGRPPRTARCAGAPLEARGSGAAPWAKEETRTQA